MRLPFIGTLLVWCPSGFGSISSVLYRPNGDDPIFYDPGPTNHVINLDAETFNDTVFNRSLPIIVEIYKDWCGHCREFRPSYHEFSRLAQNWNSTVLVAAINCADSHNRDACVNTGKHSPQDTTPSVKFFPAQARDFSQLIDMDPENAYSERTPGDVRCFAVKLMEKHSGLRSTLREKGGFIDDEKVVKSRDPYTAAWRAASKNTMYLVFVVTTGDDHRGNGTTLAKELSLDFLLYVPQLSVVDVLRYSANLPHFVMRDQSPVAVVYRRDSDVPVSTYSFEEVGTNVSRSIVEDLHLPPKGSQAETVWEPPPEAKINCSEKPKECKARFFASEYDMLKAMRQLLFDETQWVDRVEGDKLAKLADFVDVLTHYFPNETLRGTATSQPLPRSTKARLVFADLSSYLHKVPSFTYQEWNATFLELEKKHDNPFPPGRDWDHCNGTTRILRGFTCGVWMTFHTLTINFYLAHRNVSAHVNQSELALVPLRAIHGWVDGFFGCTICRKHFLNMTSFEFPMDGTNVKTIDDSFMYLWKAHNRVNQRLHVNFTASEDPQFLKLSFPPSFVCTECHVQNGGDEDFNENAVKHFLVDYFRKIKPYDQ